MKQNKFTSIKRSQPIQTTICPEVCQLNESTAWHKTWLKLDSSRVLIHHPGYEEIIHLIIFDVYARCRRRISHEPNRRLIMKENKGFFVNCIPSGSREVRRLNLALQCHKPVNYLKTFEHLIWREFYEQCIRSV